MHIDPELLFACSLLLGVQLSLSILSPNLEYSVVLLKWAGKAFQNIKGSKKQHATLPPRLRAASSQESMLRWEMQESTYSAIP